MAKDSNRTYSRKRGFNFKDEWKSFLFCFLLAMFLWMLTALSETYESRVEVTVNYINRPKNLVYSNNLPNSLRISVNARGWDLLVYYLRGGGGDVKINLEEFKNRNYLLTSRLKPSLQGQIDGKVIIHDISPDTISLSKERQFSKKVPVKLNMSLSFANQYGISDDIVYTPDSIIIAGSRENIPRIKYIETVPFSIRNINKTINTYASLKKSPTQNINYSAERIKVTIPIDQLTEKVIELPIQVVNPKFSGNVRLIPQKVTITFQTTLTKYHQIDANLFEAVVDGHQMDTVTKSPLKIQLLSYPKFIYNPHLNVEHVDYIISK